MACETRNTELDGVRLYTIQFPASRGAKMTLKLIKMFGPLVGKGEMDMLTFTEKLSEDDAIDLIQDLFSATKIKFKEDKDPREIDFETDFAGNYALMYKAALWVVQANGFFGKVDILSALNGILTKTLKEKLQMSPTDSMTP